MIVYNTKEHDALPVGSVTVFFDPVDKPGGFQLQRSEVQRTEDGWVNVNPLAHSTFAARLYEINQSFLFSYPREVFLPDSVITFDSPEWKKGAKVRLEYKDGSALEGFVEKDSGTYVKWSTMGNFSGSLTDSQRAKYIIFLEPAPDADKPVRDAILRNLSGLGVSIDETMAQDLLDNFRHEGLISK